MLSRIAKVKVSQGRRMNCQVQQMASDPLQNEERSKKWLRIF
jgi:hypothetical protein